MIFLYVEIRNLQENGPDEQTTVMQNVHGSNINSHFFEFYATCKSKYTIYLLKFFNNFIFLNAQIFFIDYPAYRTEERGSYLVRSFCLGMIYLQDEMFKNLNDISQLMKWYIENKSDSKQAAKVEETLIYKYQFFKTTKTISK